MTQQTLKLNEIHPKIGKNAGPHDVKNFASFYSNPGLGAV